MTYSIEIAQAALQKLQGILERQRVDQELLARVLTDAVEGYEAGVSKKQNSNIELVWQSSGQVLDAAEAKEIFLRNARALGARALGAQIPCAQLEEKSTHPSEVSKPSTKEPPKEMKFIPKGRKKKPADGYLVDASPEAKSAIPMQDPLKAYFRPTVVDGDTQSVLPPMKVNEPKGGHFICIKCGQPKPLRWAEIKDGIRSRWCQNCANARDEIDRPKNMRDVEF